MDIDIRCRQTEDRKQARDVIDSRLRRVLGRFAQRIRRVVAIVSEERQRQGAPRAHCAIEVQLDRGGQLQVRSSGTRLLPAVGRAMDRLGRVASDDPRLGARGFRAGA